MHKIISNNFPLENQSSKTEFKTGIENFSLSTSPSPASALKPTPSIFQPFHLFQSLDSSMESMAALLLFAFLFLCVLLIFLIFPFSNQPPPPADDETEKNQRDQSDLRAIFSTFDSDNDGFISKEELLESLNRLGFSATETEVLSMVEKADGDGDGLISLSEFTELYLGMGGDEKDEERELREAFMVFDADGDGLITAKELSLVLKSLGLKQGEREDECRKMIKSVDFDGDGMVNFEEFKTMMVVKGGKIF